MTKLIRKGDIVVDLGANVGQFTIFLSRIVGNKGKVYAFEPDPRNFLILKQRIKKFNNVVVENKAVNEKSSKLILFLHEDKSQTSLFDKSKSISAIEVDSVSLDEYFKDITKNIALIKMDVQGAEFSILRGAKNLLKRVKAIIFEFEPGLIKLANEDPKELLNFLILNGFILFDLGLFGGKIKKIKDIEDFVSNFDKQYTNILAIKL